MCVPWGKGLVRGGGGGSRSALIRSMCLFTRCRDSMPSFDPTTRSRLKSLDDKSRSKRRCFDPMLVLDGWYSIDGTQFQSANSRSVIGVTNYL